MRHGSVYTVNGAEAKRVNSAAIKTFRKCRVLPTTAESSSQFQACLGESLPSVVTGGESLLHVLQGFEGEVAGACGSALTELEGFTKVYIASVNTLQSAITGGGVGGHTGFTTQLDDSQQSLARAVASHAAFETTCKPT